MNTAKITTRKIESRDEAAVLSMVEALAAHHNDSSLLTSKIFQRDFLGPNPWITGLVVEVNDEVVGYAALSPLVRLQLGQRGMDLHHFFVETRFRGRGVGQDLMAAAIEESFAQNCSYMVVGVDGDNTAAQDFYQQQGFAFRTPGPRLEKKLIA